ncbi:MAG: ORF6N domain-containing protein [Nitrospinae bacterium]|nr:ORF6N domain-containing protein [Nitrospinota bacterium]
MKKSTGQTEAVVPGQDVARRIFLIRGHRVMIDRDLAGLYGVETKYLNKAVKRNLDRFPDDFMFQLTEEEYGALRFQFGTSKTGKGGRRYLPYAFTEQGVAMLSSVLKSKKAVQVNIAIMRAFVRIRELALTHKTILRKLEDLERKYVSHDVKIETIFEAIKELMIQPGKPARRIGFKPGETGGGTRGRKPKGGITWK